MYHLDGNSELAELALGLPHTVHNFVAVPPSEIVSTSCEGKLIANIMACLAEFERDLVRERVRSGLAAAKARGQKLGRQPGQRIKADRLGPKVLRMVKLGYSYRQIARELHLSKTTVSDIVKRHRQETANLPPSAACMNQEDS